VTSLKAAEILIFVGDDHRNEGRTSKCFFARPGDDLLLQYWQLESDSGGPSPDKSDLKSMKNKQCQKPEQAFEV